MRGVTALIRSGRRQAPVRVTSACGRRTGDDTPQPVGTGRPGDIAGPPPKQVELGLLGGDSARLDEGVEGRALKADVLAQLDVRDAPLGDEAADEPLVSRYSPACATVNS